MDLEARPPPKASTIWKAGALQHPPKAARALTSSRYSEKHTFLSQLGVSEASIQSFFQTRLSVLLFWAEFVWPFILRSEEAV